MLREMKITGYVDSVANNKAFPGGGSVAALAGSLASALASMVAELTIGKKGYESVNDDMKQVAGQCRKFCEKLNELIDLDSDAYKMVMQAFKLPKDSEQQKLDRVVAIQDAILYAAEIPLQTMENVRGGGRFAFEGCKAWKQKHPHGRRGWCIVACCGIRRSLSQCGNKSG